MKNKTFKGTPGPWHVSKNYKEQVRADINIPIANVHSMLAPSDIKANARLIAAAPELLEALDRLVDLIDSEGEGLECGMPTPQQWYDARNKAEAAIDKALGNE